MTEQERERLLTSTWIAIGALVDKAIDINADIHLWRYQVPPKSYRAERLKEILDFLLARMDEIGSGVREMVRESAQKAEKAPF